MIGKIYFKNLDGLRAIAAMAVVFRHIASWIPSEGSFNEFIKKLLSFSYQGGKYGVIFFFILSGFLISYLLFHEQKINGRIKIGRFYMRRILRIWPLYYLTVLIGFYIYPVFVPEAIISASEIYYWLFLTNFDHIYHGGPELGILGVQWSVAVEEQFYLFWPLIFLIRNNKVKISVFLVLIVLSEFFYLKQNEWALGYFHFFSCIRYLGVGAIIAYLAYFKKTWINSFFSKISKFNTLVIYVVSIFVLFFGPQLNEWKAFKIVLEFLPFIFFSFVILEQNYSEKSIFKLNCFKKLTWLGKISYGIYLNHMIAIYIVNALFISLGPDYFLIKVLLSVSLTILISYLSYRYFESFFLRFKYRFSGYKQSLTKPKLH